MFYSKKIVGEYKCHYCKNIIPIAINNYGLKYYALCNNCPVKIKYILSDDLSIVKFVHMYKSFNSYRFFLNLSEIRTILLDDLNMKTIFVVDKILDITPSNFDQKLKMILSFNE